MIFGLMTRKVDGVIIVDISGGLTTGEPTLRLRETDHENCTGGIKPGSCPCLFFCLGQATWGDTSFAQAATCSDWFRCRWAGCCST